MHCVKSDVTHLSDGMNSYFDRGQQATETLNADASAFTPRAETQQIVSSKDGGNAGAKANKGNVSQKMYSQNISKLSKTRVVT